MATMFGGSRLANLREKRTSGDESAFKKEETLKLSLPADETEKSSYEPTTSSFLSRTQTRLLKGRIQRPHPENQEQRNTNENFYQPASSTTSCSKKESSPPSQNLKLVIHDDPPKDERRSSVQSNPMRTTQKRILITKQPERQQIEKKPIESVQVQPLVQKPEPEPERPIIFNEEKPIKEEQIQESMQNENDLVECPQGCGRKFNRKALEKHAKACKLVFMSKRKEFNSEAKRLGNKEQAALLKQQKEKQKKGLGKSKGFEKTSENWKAASQNFRAVVKAIKKDADDEQEKEEGEDEEEMKIVVCQFCDKPFAEVFLQKHVQTCAKKKEAEKKKTFKKK